MKKFNLTRSLSALALPAALLLAQSALAAEVVITTLFKADATRPTHNQFENTTPVSGFCGSFSAYCHDGEFSVLVPGFTAYKQFDSSSGDLNRHTFISLDGTTKPVTLTDVNNPANQMTADFRWAFFGVRHNRINAQDGDLSAAMSGTGVSPEGGCSGRIGSGHAGIYNHGWGVPERLIVCYKMLNSNHNYQGTVKIDNLSIGYTLTTPSPMGIRAGEYEGVIEYRVGDVMNAPGYIGLGADDYNGEEVIRIVIKATVEHVFELRFPPGSERVKLAAKGGWSQWINGGRIPEQLQKQVPFILSSSTGFKVTMLCEHQQGPTCGLKSTLTDDTVPVEVLISLPGFSSDGGPVSRQLLTTNRNGQKINPPQVPIFNRRSTLDFQVKRAGVEQMVQTPGSAWRGVVTLIFDSEVE